jgi:hypothetical protein
MKLTGVLGAAVVALVATAAEASTMTLLPSSAPADGTSRVAIQVTITDPNGVPLAGQLVTFRATGSGNMLSATSAVSDANGFASTSLTSTVAELKVVTAEVPSQVAAVSTYSVVTFTGPWTPPLGIPRPSFGTTETAPATPANWSAPTPGFYYVNQNAPGATDTQNPYGYPARPRVTIPLAIPAGSVVEVHGAYDHSHGSPNGIVVSGTAASPVFIRGTSATTKPTLSRGWELSGSYCVLENLEFALQSPDIENLVVGAGNHLVVRGCDIHGYTYGGETAVAGAGPGQEATDVVLWANYIHDNGDWQATFYQKVHGIQVSAYVSRLWVLDNVMTRNSGDGIQINAGSAQATTHHIFVGRNLSFQNKQDGFWTKQAVDVIFSQNTAFASRPDPLNLSLNAGLGFQYGPERVWFLYNNVFDCENGIASGSDDGGFGQYSFYIGNVIHNIHTINPGAYNATTGWSSGGMMLAGGVNRFILNNTIDDVDAGINSPGSGALYIVNNIISGVTRPDTSHVFIEQPSTAAASSIANDLFDAPVRIRWGDPSTTYDLTSFTSSFPTRVQGCLVGAPLFVNRAQGNYQLQLGSPAIDAGANVQTIFDYYKGLYGVDIARDLLDTPRPQGAAIDIGAFER